MPKMSIYLPENLYAVVKAQDLPVSEILQEALRAKLEVDEKLRALDEFIADLVAEVGEPTEAEIRAAEQSAERIAVHARRRRSDGGSTAGGRAA
jgi:hypothetical protein